MKKGVFVSCERKIDEKADQVNGVLKKVFAQIQTLNIKDVLSCEHIELPNTRMRYIFDSYKYSLKYERDIDFFYIRRITPVDNRVLSFLARIKSNNPGCKILYEIPTYPYDKEDNIITLCIDKLHRMKLQKYIDRIVTVSKDDLIFDIPTIKMVNGILCTNIPLRKSAHKNNELHLIAVANFASYHGYDRLIRGLYDYYNKGSCKNKVYLHFVGAGITCDKYEKLIKQYGLDEYCLFHGYLSGDELTHIYNQCDMAVCSLGIHRKGIYTSSELKSREYLARGFPIITSAKIDVLPSEYKYCLKISEDESPVNIIGIVNFYENIISTVNEADMIIDIRKFAEAHCEISKTMIPVIEYILKA
jgi:glycosyltransferase involved in cell wall biosynthesis